MKPQFILSDREQGLHNLELDKSIERLKAFKSYQDLSTVIICPTRGLIPARVVTSFISLLRPMNQKVVGPLFITGMEVGAAYEAALEMILANPELSKYKYLLTIEEDNILPMDGLLKLYEHMDEYDVIGGLYWTKGEGGQPMIYGDPKDKPVNFIPQMPIPDAIQECNGLGMGMTLFSMDMLKKLKEEVKDRPLFKTEQTIVPNEGVKVYTQDLRFFEIARKYGYRFASNNQVRVGHYDINTDVVW